MDPNSLMMFSVAEKQGKGLKERELKPGGAEIQVTQY